MDVKEYILVPKGTYEELVDKHTKYVELLSNKEPEGPISNPIDIADLDKQQEENRQEPIPDNYKIPEIKEHMDSKYSENKLNKPKKTKETGKKKNKNVSLLKHERWVPYP